MSDLLGLDSVVKSTLGNGVFKLSFCLLEVSGVAIAEV